MSTRRILAIETSGRTGSAAVGDEGGVLATRQLDGEMRHAGQFLPTVQQLLADRGWPADSLTEVFVSIGPGSFTGLRIGVTVARTLAWSVGVRIVPVPTLDALARNALAVQPLPPFVAVILDAKRGQVYAAAFSLAADTGQGDSVTGFGRDNEATAAQAGGGRHGGPAIRITRVIGPVLEEPGPFLARCPHPLAVLGEGSTYHRAAIDASGVTLLDPAQWPGRAESVFAVGLEMAAAGQFTPAGDLLPLYIRRPEAEEKWEKLHPTEGQAK